VPEDYSVETITNSLLDYAVKYDNSRSQNPYELLKRHAHIVLVHKLTLTPTGVYLEGPEPEVSNRVLRLYKDCSDYFMRVTSTDEDGEPVHYDGRTDQKGVYARFKMFVESEYSIAGRSFSFLRFSYSSLRSQTCWFMVPFESGGRMLSAPGLIRNLVISDTYAAQLNAQPVSVKPSPILPELLKWKLGSRSDFVTSNAMVDASAMVAVRSRLSFARKSGVCMDLNALSSPSSSK
jgi:hypothetical protein